MEINIITNNPDKMTIKIEDREVALMVRVCEATWHEIIQLEPFEKCSRCFSESNHKVIELKKFNQIKEKEKHD